MTLSDWKERRRALPVKQREEENGRGQQKRSARYFVMQRTEHATSKRRTNDEQTTKKRNTRISIDMTGYVDVTGGNEDPRYACKTELQTAPKFELGFHPRLSPSSSHSFQSF